MKVNPLCFVVLCLFNSQIFANQTSAVSSNSPTQIARDINSLYINVIKNDVSYKQRKEVMCHQLPAKINEYKSAALQGAVEKQQLNIFLTTMKKNIEQTKDYLNILC